MLYIYDQHYNNTFHKKLESIQYNAALAITGAIRGSSGEKLYQELCSESLLQRRWFRKLCYFLKITKNQSSKYLFDKIQTTRTVYRTRNNINNQQYFLIQCQTYLFWRTRSSRPLQFNGIILRKILQSSENFAVFQEKHFTVHTTISKEGSQMPQPYWNYKA